MDLLCPDTPASRRTLVPLTQVPTKTGQAQHPTAEECSLYERRTCRLPSAADGGVTWCGYAQERDLPLRWYSSKPGCPSWSRCRLVRHPRLTKGKGVLGWASSKITGVVVQIFLALVKKAERRTRRGDQLLPEMQLDRTIRSSLAKHFPVRDFEHECSSES